MNSTIVKATSTYNRLQVYNCFVNVVRVVRTNTAAGISEVPSNVVTNMPCRIRWHTGKERLQFDKQTYYRDATLHCRIPAGVTITNTDKIDYKGETFEIVDVRDFRNLGRLLAIELRKID